MSFVIGEDGRGAEDFTASADFTDEVAERNQEWLLDLSDEVIGSWRGGRGRSRRSPSCGVSP